MFYKNFEWNNQKKKINNSSACEFSIDVKNEYRSNESKRKHDDYNWISIKNKILKLTKKKNWKGIVKKYKSKEEFTLLSLERHRNIISS
jgi:hypothetical protein